ncbi:MAG: peptidylprolyl isomerase [bacterium]|nr:peptidylprolyl isomerase [bacterium]
MNQMIYLCMGWLVFLLGCGDRAEIERLTQLKERLETENRSLKSSLTKFQPQFKRVEEIDKRFSFLITELKKVQARLVTNLGTIEVRFFPEDAPLHCMNFVARAEGGFYNGTQFHRVIPGFMIQGGDPNSKDKDPYNDGQGGPVFHLPHEFNKHLHKPGILSTARDPNKTVGAGSQFFIMHGTSPNLDGDYTVFGEVTKGMDVVDKIANTPIHQQDPRLRDHPIKPVIIQSVEIYKK